MLKRCYVLAVLFVLFLSSFMIIPSADAEEITRSIRSFDTEVKGGLYDGLITYEDVALIVNDNSEMSREIGTYFAQRRGLPQINIINISVPEKEIITFSEYDELARQVKENLSKRGLTNKIEYMVTTKGVPLKVTSGQYNMNYYAYYESASVDSELMLLDSNLEGEVHRRWWADNPYAGSGEPFSRETYKVRLVTRLTGYTKEEAMSLVDRAEGSLGSRGNAFLDLDPTKNGSGGYRQGNIWMVDAHNWLKGENYPSKLEDTRDFQTDKQDLMAYYSWGSNDGDWSEGQMSNGGFEAGTGPQASSWTYEVAGGDIERSSESVRSGSWALKLERNGTGKLRAYQDITLNYLDHRYLPDARMSISGVTTPGARIILEGYNASSTLVWSHELANRTGNRGFDAYQDPLENESSVTMIRFIVELLGEGTAYFDNLNMRVIRPHNTWVNGSIAETIVSTGGRSMTYGTWYGQSLVADIIRDGVTGLKGYTWEPFITAVSRAHILFPAYYSGYNLAESFWMGSPYVSWMGTVIGDPKVTPFINERPDMGPTIETDPIYTWVDEEGTSWVTFAIHNKGGRAVEQGMVQLFMEGDAKFKEVLVDMEPGETLYLNISSEEEQILGQHEFTAVLDVNDEVWEYDEKNNEFSENLTVNHRPEMSVNVPTSEVRRTDKIGISFNITDLDLDLSTDGIDILITGPGGALLYPTLEYSSLSGSLLTAEYSHTPVWNATLGFYSMEVTYTDPQGSFVYQKLFGSFKVINYDPSLSGNITTENVHRGGYVTVELLWSDPDTPDGSLVLSSFAEDPMGSKIEPENIIPGSAFNTSVIYHIPPDFPAQTWVFSAMVQDKNGGYAEWSSLLRTFNREPSIEVLSGTGSRITRLESVSFSIKYSDPEGQASEELNIIVFGPEGSPSTTIIYDDDQILGSGEVMELEISGFGLQLGNYTIEIEYTDDQGLGGRYVVVSAFEVYNIEPVIDDLSVKYPHGDDEPGRVLMRGDSVTLTATGYDPDGGNGPLDVNAFLISNVSGEERSIRFDSRGSSSYSRRISTDGEWAIGAYTLLVKAVDRDGAVFEYDAGVVFFIDADVVTFQFGKVFVDLNISANAEIVLGSSYGASSPVSVHLLLFDDNGTLVGQEDLIPTGSADTWTAVFQLTGIPDTGNIKIQDDLGRTIWSNGTLTLEIEKEPVNIKSHTGPDNNNSTMLMILLLLTALMILMVVVLFAIILMRPKPERYLMPAPPMGVPLPGANERSGLPPVQPPSLPPSSSENTLAQNAVPAHLPPGRELLDGSSYHRPDVKVEENRARSTAGNLVIGTGIPPPSPEHPQTDTSKPTNTGSDLEPSKEDVQNTDGPDSAGDTGQGQQKGEQGPGSRPGLQVPDAEAQQGQG